MIQLQHTFTAFRSRNFSLFFIGQFISRIGLWVQRTAVIWVVYTLTHSTFMIGVTAFAEQFPSFLLSLWGGIVADKYNRFTILLTAQVIAMIQAALLAALLFSHHNAVWAILALSVLLGIVNAFEVPTRQSMIHLLVNDETHLANAVALNSSLTTLAWLIGPAISGILLQHLGAGTCFLINAISFIAIIVCLLLMKFSPGVFAVQQKQVQSHLSEGFAYLKSTPSLYRIILMLACASLFVLCYQTLIPVFSKVIFSGNAATFGYLNSCIGMGSFAAAISLASLQKQANRNKLLLGGVLLLGIGLICFSFTHSLALACVFAVLIGFGSMTLVTNSMTIIQVNAEAHMRGRIMSYVAMAYFGMIPIGSLLAGAVSQRTSAPVTMFAEGMIALLIATTFGRYLIGKKQQHIAA